MPLQMGNGPALFTFVKKPFCHPQSYSMSQQTSLFELQTLEILLLISPPENWKKWAREVNKQCLDLFSLPCTLPYVPHISLAEFTFDPSASLKLVASLKQNLSGSGAFEVSL